MTDSTRRSVCDSGEPVAHADEDVRGRKALASAGKHIDAIDGLMKGGCDYRLMRAIGCVTTALNGGA